MLTRKMLREIRENLGQFLSLFILAAISVMMFTVFQSSTNGADRARKVFHEQTNLSDGWLYGEGFSAADLKAVLALSPILDAQLRTKVTGKSVEQNNAQIDIFLEEEAVVTVPLVLEGDPFDPSDTDRLWLSKTFADAWNIRPGDSFSLDYEGAQITKTVAGLIATPEYEYTCADDDLDTDYSHIGYVYLSYDAVPVEELMENLRASGKISAADWMAYKLASAVKGNDMIPRTELIFTTDEKDVMSLEEQLSDALGGNYAVLIDQSKVDGIQRLNDELTQHRQFSFLFSVIFLLIGLLVIMTTMNRMVVNQRTQIGTMNALGLERRKITLHYMSYSFVVSAFGGLVGLLAGPLWGGRAFVDLFSTYYTVPGWKPVYSAVFLGAYFAIIASCTVVAYLSCRKLLKVAPAEALRPAPPKSGKHSIFEKLPFWNRLGFYSQYDLRDISRAKVRTFMGIFGTACGMMLMVCALACYSTMDNVYEWSFEKLQHYDYNAQLSDDVRLEKADELAAACEGELVMLDAVEVAAKDHALAGEKETTAIVVTEGKGFWGLTDEDQNVRELEPGTVALSSKLANTLGLGVGDTLHWHLYARSDWHESTIGLISRNPTVSGITILRSDFEAEGLAFTPQNLYTDQDITGLENTDSAVALTRSHADFVNAYIEQMSVIYILIYVLIAFSAILIIVVLYNSGNLSFHERIRELATLKVLGFTSTQIRRMLSLQNLWLCVIGMILGAPFGKVMLQYMFDSNGESYDYQAVVSFGAYAGSAVLVVAVTLLVGFLFAKRIRKLDMVDVLKGME